VPDQPGTPSLKHNMVGSGWNVNRDALCWVGMCPGNKCKLGWSVDGFGICWDGMACSWIDGSVGLN
jgi:hypothetical protein